MRRKFSFFAVLLILIVSIFSVNCGAVTIEDEKLDIEIPENYTVITDDNIDSNLEFLQEINFNKINFKEYISKNKIILFARDNDTNSEIVVKRETGVLSEDFSLELLSDESLAEIAPSLTGGKSCVKVSIGDNVFLKTEFSGSDKGGAFSGEQYITVKQGDLWAIEFTGVGSEETDNIIKSVVFGYASGNNNSDKAAGINNVVTIILIIAAIVFAVVIAIYIIVTFVIDIRARRNTSDVAPYVKIKRRKF